MEDIFTLQKIYKLKTIIIIHLVFKTFGTKFISCSKVTLEFKITNF